MASFEGPASSGGELYGAPSSPMTAPSVPEAPKLTPERAQQELARLTAIIKDNPNLHFLEPRVVKCVEVGTQDSATFLSFYRLISQSLSEELMQQKDRIKELEGSAAEQKKVSAQSEIEAALAEASEAVNRAQGQPTAETAPAPAAEGGGETSPQVDELLKKLEQAEIQRERLLQDMQNMRNRSKTDIDVKVFKAVEKFTQSLLPALDAFHQAMPSLQTATDTASIVTGIEMIHEQLENALKQAGLQKLNVVGQPFDPHLHEAIGEVQTSEVPDDHIYDQLQPGYLFGERLVRAAIVRIARNDGSAAPSVPAQPAAEPSPAATTAEPTQAAQPATEPTPAGQPAAEVAAAQAAAAAPPAAEERATAHTAEPVAETSSQPVAPAASEPSAPSQPSTGVAPAQPPTEAPPAAATPSAETAPSQPTIDVAVQPTSQTQPAAPVQPAAEPTPPPEASLPAQPAADTPAPAEAGSTAPAPVETATQAAPSEPAAPPATLAQPPAETPTQAATPAQPPTETAAQAATPTQPSAAPAHQSPEVSAPPGGPPASPEASSQAEAPEVSSPAPQAEASPPSENAQGSAPAPDSLQQPPSS